MTAGTDWVEQARRLVETLGGTLGGLTGHSGADDAGPGAPECRWCPLCQSLAVLRGERPEVTAVLADVLTAAADALRAFAAAPEPPAAAGRDEPAAAGAHPPEGDPPPVVQRIEIA
jgi:hypothetical protein